MPKRILAGGVAWWEPLVALGLLAAFAVVTVWVGERLYRRALLQTGGRVSLRQAWSAAGVSTRSARAGSTRPSGASTRTSAFASPRVGPTFTIATGMPSFAARSTNR